MKTLETLRTLKPPPPLQDPHLRNTKGKTAAALAEGKGNQALHDLLLQFMRVM
jgi:hypothetical protein